MQRVQKDSRLQRQCRFRCFRRASVSRNAHSHRTSAYIPSVWRLLRLWLVPCDAVLVKDVKGVRFLVFPRHGPICPAHHMCIRIRPTVLICMQLDVACRLCRFCYLVPQVLKQTHKGLHFQQRFGRIELTVFAEMLALIGKSP